MLLQKSLFWKFGALPEFSKGICIVYDSVSLSDEVHLFPFVNSIQSQRTETPNLHLHVYVFPTLMFCCGSGGSGVISLRQPKVSS